MRGEIRGKRGRNEHLTNREIAAIFADFKKGFRLPYICETYRISSRIAYKYKRMWREL